MLINVVMLLWGGYVATLVAAWGYWYHLLEKQASMVVYEWQNVVLSSVVWFNVALYMAFVTMVVFLRFQRSTLAITPYSRRFVRTKVVADEDVFEAGDLELTPAPPPAKRKQRVTKQRRAPTASEVEDDKGKREETALARQLQALVQASQDPDVEKQLADEESKDAVVEPCVKATQV